MPWNVPAQGSAGGSAPRSLHRLQQDLAGATLERLGRTTREREQQDALRIRTVANEARDPVRERAGLAGTGAGDDRKRWSGAGSRSMSDRLALGRVEGGQWVVDFGVLHVPRRLLERTIVR